MRKECRTEGKGSAGKRGEENVEVATRARDAPDRPPDIFPRLESPSLPERRSSAATIARRAARPRTASSAKGKLPPAGKCRVAARPLLVVADQFRRNVTGPVYPREAGRFVFDFAADNEDVQAVRRTTWMRGQDASERGAPPGRR